MDLGPTPGALDRCLKQQLRTHKSGLQVLFRNLQVPDRTFVSNNDVHQQTKSRTGQTKHQELK